MAYYFEPGYGILWHRLLCHSLVRLEQRAASHFRLQAIYAKCRANDEKRYKVQECDATKASGLFNCPVHKKLKHFIEIGFIGNDLWRELPEPPYIASKPCYFFYVAKRIF